MLPGKCFPGGRKFCFACKALTHIHRHTSECSLTGVRKQSKFFCGYSHYPQSQPAGEAESNRYCSSRVPNKLPPAPHPPTSTHSHKKHKRPVMGTFPSGARSLSGERKQNPNQPRCHPAKHLARFRVTNSPEMPATWNPRALVAMRCSSCNCSFWLCFHPLVSGGAMSVGCPINTGRVGVLLEA